MIRAEELMLDDWVLAYGKKTQVVWTGNVKKLAVRGFPSEFFEDEILPIPITPEILEENGIRYQIGHPWWQAAEMEDGVFEIHLTEKCTMRLKYVHELQHALKLCGIPKNIEL